MSERFFYIEKEDWITALKWVWSIFTLVSVIVIALFLFLPDDLLLQASPQCFSVKLYNTQCFMCGSTRAWVALCNADISAAINQNVLSVMLFFAGIINILFALLKTLKYLTKCK